jgi:hypothetical protein
MLMILFSNCGKTSVSVDEYTYEPKIVINGYIYPERPVSGIVISRNFAIGQTIDKDRVMLRDADVTLTDLGTDVIYPLVYRQADGGFYYPGNDLDIAYGGNYRLDVQAVIDGRELRASSETSVPLRGLEIDRDQSVSGDVYYRQTDSNGNLITPQIYYRQSENAAFFLLSVSAVDASVESFIYENPFEFDIQELLDEGGDIEDVQYTSRWTRPENQNNGESVMEVSWFQIWFYGTYRMILYAGDQNFYHYYTTHANVQEPDGNLHEPIFEIDGDGIGVFGSAVADTVYINILRNP